MPEQDVITRPILNATVEDLRREIRTGDEMLRQEIQATDKLLQQQHATLEKTLIKLDTKIDTLLEWRTVSIAGTASDNGRDKVLATILASVVALLVTILGYVISRGIVG